MFSFEFDLNPWGVANAKKMPRKRLWKPKQILRVPAAIIFISNLFPVLLDRFVVFTSCMLHLEVSRIKKKQNTNPTPDMKFFVDLNGPGILRDATLSDILVQQYYFLICLIAKLTHLKRKLCSFSDHAWDFRPFKKCFL